LMGGIRVDKLKILERLVSIKSNAQERAAQDSNRYLNNEIKACILEHGIEQLIMEIQNTILVDYQISKTTAGYNRGVSVQPSYCSEHITMLYNDQALKDAASGR